MAATRSTASIRSASRFRTPPADATIRVEVFLGGAPLLEPKIGAGLLEFARHHPRWRFSMRGPDFRYRASWLREQGISGVLVLIDDSSVSRVLNRAGVPWVYLLPAKQVQHPCVAVDDHAIGRMGAEFLLGRGFLRCAFCGAGTVWSDRRAEGFRATVEAAGRACQVVDIPFAQDRDWGLASGASRWLRRWVAGLTPGTAVMAAHDTLANCLVDTCLQRGLRIPQDVAVLGVGNHDMLCQLSPVPISSVDTNVPLAAAQAATLLGELIDGRTPAPPPLVQPGGIVERRSTEIVVYGDDLVARVVAHIRSQADAGTSVASLLRFFPVSRRTLSRRFARFVGHSPAAEIRQARLRQARDMVKHSRLSLTEIAVTCGYADLPHMDRAFRRETGSIPSALR